MDKNFFAKIQEKLFWRLRKVEEEIKAVSEDDPVMADSLAETSEPGTDSWKTDAHTQLTAMKQNLVGVLERVKKALFNLQNGNYGKCEKCNVSIEKDRLEAMPETSLCMVCSSNHKK